MAIPNLNASPASAPASGQATPQFNLPPAPGPAGQSGQNMAVASSAPAVVPTTQSTTTPGTIPSTQASQSSASSTGTGQTITIPGTGQTLTQLTPLSAADVHALLQSAQKFPQAFSGSALTQSANSSTTNTGTSEATAGGSYDTSQIQSQLQAAVTQEFGAAAVPAVMQIVGEESGFNPTAQNAHSTAYGLFQFLDSTWQGVGAQKTSSPTQQIQAGLQYIKQRYGTPQNALAFHNANGWY